MKLMNMLDFFGFDSVKQLMITNVCDDCPERTGCHRRKSIDPAFTLWYINIDPENKYFLGETI